MLHTYDEILMNSASKFLSQHDLYNTLMQNPQDGLQFKGLGCLRVRLF